MDLIAPLPKTIEIETSSICNLRCVMCPQAIEGGVPRPNHLPESLSDKLIPLFNENTECISLHGIGEPFLSKSFWKILPHIPKECHHVQANTNLTVLTDKMLDTIISSNFTLLNVSLDGPDEELYQKIRGFDLSTVLSNISKLVTAREASDNRHLKIHANMTLMKCNIDMIIEFMDLIIGSLGCDAVQVWPMNNWGPENRKYNTKVRNFDFNYEDQGLWNYKDLYFKRIEEAKLHATKNRWKLIVHESMEE